ncbi:centrosomal protein of 41 kDa B-like [Pocillopora verrucosa]|uniref:centrosomal protein of 41 kDa B-like n=1 Tax=Pocillopora damicornis TaxID=46731 RepID=UPI000F54DC60|nr:centrosomal protein of 41 kDa B-like [Pocillopora damicornis]XP_058968812.1 centrosomal protein of 41 kDa B-like [Pocillopora verrucosa]
MSATSRSVKKPPNILEKKIHKNPKYDHIGATVDTGASISRYEQKIEEMRKNYKYRKDEIFKRMKVSTLAQLILQVAEAVSLEQERNSISTAGGESVMSDETITAEDKETPREGEGIPPLNLEDDEARPDSTARSSARSTLQSLIHGVGEVDIRDKDEKEDNSFDEEQLSVPEVESLPYLLLDVRDEDAYKQCHIIGALSYPSSMLSRSYNYFTKEILTFKNKLGKIIILYDEDERLAPAAATTFVQREVDNVFMLSGGLKVLYKKFPEGLVAGQVPQSCWPTPPPSRKSSGKATSATRPSPCASADQKWFYPEDLVKLQDKLDDELLSQDKSSRQNSRLSSRSAASSASRASTAASSATSRSSKPVWK